MREREREKKRQKKRKAQLTGKAFVAINKGRLIDLKKKKKKRKKMEMNMKKKSEVLDGSDIMKLVGNDQVFSNFVDHKFQELDTDCDGKLSVKELQPAVADLGAALGLPSQGSSTDSDYIYSEVNFPVFCLLFFCRLILYERQCLGTLLRN